MKKAEQIKINGQVIEAMRDCKTLMSSHNAWNVKRLRSCNAMVYNVQGMKILKSYNTVVAVIDNGVCYDFLRYVYGYTATTAQHISKFCNDYNAYKKLTYKEA